MPLRCPWARPRSQAAAEDTSPGDGWLSSPRVRLHQAKEVEEINTSSLPASNPHLLAPYKSSDKNLLYIFISYILSGTHLYLWKFLLEKSSSQSSTGTPQKDETVGRYKSTGDIRNNDSLLRHNVCACRPLLCVCVCVTRFPQKKENAAGSWVMVAKTSYLQRMGKSE